MLMKQIMEFKTFYIRMRLVPVEHTCKVCVEVYILGSTLPVSKCTFHRGIYGRLAHGSHFDTRRYNNLVNGLFDHGAHKEFIIHSTLYKC
jgi:hypothetical protein